MERLIFIVVGIALVVLFALLAPVVSKWRGARRVRASGALWAGYALLDADDEHPRPEVRQALDGMGKAWGHRLAPGNPTRPVGGVLYIHEDRVDWQPRLWLGRGDAESWSIPSAEIRGVRTEKLPAPKIRSYVGVLETLAGEIRVGIVDPSGFEEAAAAAAA